MRILMCLSGHFPPDIRVEKEARALIKAGHELFLLCKNRQNQTYKTIVESINVIRVNFPQSLLGRAWNYAFLCMSFKHPIWEKLITDAVSKYHIQAIHVHDLPLVNTGLSVAHKFHIPLIADLHEIYSEAVKIYTSGFLRGRLLYSLGRWRQQERRCLKYSDAIITVSQEAKDYFVKTYEVPADKLTVIMNTVDLGLFYSFPIKKGIVDKLQSYFIIAYTGSFGRHRGIQTAVEAMPKIVSHVPHARLLLVGSVSKETLQQWAGTDTEKVAIEKYVIVTGWQDYALFPSYISASKVCLIPHVVSSPQLNASSPNKLFEYMALGKPVVVSSAKSLQRIIAETGAGLVFRSEDANALAEAVIKLYNNKELADRLGQAGLVAVKAKYNWEMEGEKLTKLYVELEQKNIKS